MSPEPLNCLRNAVYLNGMKIIGIVFLLLLSMNVFTQTPNNLAEIWDKNHISTMFPSDVRHKDVKAYVEKLNKLGLKVDEVGRSGFGREIYQVEFGHGPLKVFMWSQMHGDEPTATSALIDMLAYFQTHRDTDWVKKIAETLTIRVVPMLNPDGAEVYKRRNLQDIDINRDAINLRTPEAQLLKRLRNDWSPAIGFNLHNQQELTSVGQTFKQAAISLLVVSGDDAKTLNYGQERNRRIAAEMTVALQNLIPGHIGRYADEWTPTAFGDNFSAWGTPVILVETGALYGFDEMYLVKLNFVAFITALQSITTGSEKLQDPNPYLTLPHNGSGDLVHFLFRRANIVKQTGISIADISVVTARRRASFIAPNTIKSVGLLAGLRGLEEYETSGFKVVQRFGSLQPGSFAELCFYRKDRVVDFNSADLEKSFPPDAIFSSGKWFKGEGVVPKIK